MKQEAKLSDLLLTASGEEPQKSAQTPPRHTAALRRAYRAEEQGECPQCGYKAPITDFELDSTGDESGDSDKEPWETADEATESKLASMLLNLATKTSKPSTAAKKSEPKLTREQVQSILNSAVDSLRNPRIK